MWQLVMSILCAVRLPIFILQDMLGVAYNCDYTLCLHYHKIHNRICLVSH